MLYTHGIKMYPFKVIFSFGILSVFFSLIVSCDEKNETNTLGETELFFDDITTSLSSCDDGSVWVGSETGRIWNVKNNSTTVYDAGSERIYKVYSYPEDNHRRTLWIGMRNSGLQKWKLADDDFKKEKSYAIAVKGKKYSPYDIARIGNSLFIATTQGLYKQNLLHEKDTLELVYPSAEDLQETFKNSFVVNSLCEADGHLYAATEYGILSLDAENDNPRIILPGMSVNHLSVNNDTLYALSGNSLLLLSKDGKLNRDVKLQFRPSAYYYYGGIHYLANRDDMLISKDLNQFVFISLRKKVADKCKNIFLPDPKSDFILLLMEDALWRIPKHTGVLEGNDFVKNACAANKHIYYLTADNDLYLQKDSDKRANPIFTFPKSEQIIWMGTNGDELYYYNSKQEVKVLTISHSLLKNMLLLKPRLIYTSEHKITSAYLQQINNKSEIYLGIQDGLIRLDAESGESHSLPDFERRYVTAFYMPQHSKVLYLSTLNSGIFYKTENTCFKYIDGTMGYESIKDILITNEYHPRLITLTNHDIYSHMPSDSLIARGCSKLLYVNDSLIYSLSGSGIRRIEINDKGEMSETGHHYKDIRFNASASFVTNGKLYLGSAMGLLVLSPGNEEEAYWVSFVPNVIFSFKYLFLFIAVLILFVCYAIFRHYRRKRRTHRQLQKQLLHLKDCAEELNSYYHVSNESEKEQIRRLKQNIECIDISTGKRKELNQQMDVLTDEIIQLNREVSLRLLKKLEQQIAVISAINAFEAKDLQNISQSILKSNEIDHIRSQVEKNEKWINDYESLQKDLRIVSDQLTDCAEIDGVTTCIINGIAHIREDIVQKPLDDLLQSFSVLQSSYEDLYSDTVLNKILGYIEQQISWLQGRKHADTISEFLIVKLEEIKNDTNADERLQMLRLVNDVSRRVRFLRIKDEIEECMHGYIRQRNHVMAQNDQLINKKFDKELDLWIADQTKVFVDKLENLIVSMYKLLNITDHPVITDLLKINSFYHQQAKVLALLIVNPRVKRSLIPGMLGIYGNLNPVISRLINNKIKSNEDFFKLYIEKDPMNIVFVYYVLKLIE